MGLEPIDSVHVEGDDAAEWRQIWRSLEPNARETLGQLCRKGPTYDGNIVSKAGRGQLFQLKLASRVVLANCEYGYSAATYLGAHVWKAGQALKAAV